MKYLLIIILMSGAFIHTVAQNPEFKIYENGLIYSEETMDRLSGIVDSLNLQFVACEQQPVYSLYQGISYLYKGSVPSKFHDETFQEFRKRKPYANLEKVWMVREEYMTSKGERVVEYSDIRNSFSISLESTEANLKTSGWIVDNRNAVYLDLHKVELPVRYSSMVNYVDCMIDTTAQIFTEDAIKSFRGYDDDNISLPIKQFTEWVLDFPGRPVLEISDSLSDEEFQVISDRHRSAFEDWDKKRMEYIDRKMDEPYYSNQLYSAYAAAVNGGASTALFEYYVERYISKVAALELKRARRVYGTCSMDQSPRYHALSICRLSAETARWDIFLRSHLNIMNDRFDRVSDGSYAWGRRNTYLKELEQLDINTIDLLLGVCFAVEGLSDNHYYGNLRRIGRSLAESAQAREVEDMLLEIISDAQVDPLNRRRFAIVLVHYCRNLTDEEYGRQLFDQLFSEVSTWPEYLSLDD